MKILYATVVVLLAGMSLFAQEQKPKAEPQGKPAAQPEVVVIAPLPDPASRPLAVPEISLQRALKFAEKYLQKEGAKLSLLHLIHAEFVFVGDEKNPAPSWHFRWRRKGSTSMLGFDVELYVFMNGRVWNPPTM